MAETIVVGCKLPHGLRVDLVLSDAGNIQQFKLNGANASRIVGGYGLTTGVPREPFERWIKDHAQLPYVRNGSIFIEGNQKRAEDVAKERRSDVKTGLEAIDPLAKKDVRNRHLVEHVDGPAERAYREQVAKNPDRNRQQVE